ncbi:hypothetical protein OG819_53060 [Streptomyces sp. NBC_01549]|uniref:hypothetical protein n=2 Tax=Streptomyces TaxID=1883 RepID=UPI002B1CC034|nr:hypothetical protein [Streptomyces sp. NBC_01549]MCX4597948.1 hypothetical protein [Streptomyces sp. NBC_01549]
MGPEKPFTAIWSLVKRDIGKAAGVDGESIEQFEADLKGNLYKLWNRLSSGSYFPPTVRMVEIEKPQGRVIDRHGVGIGLSPLSRRSRQPDRRSGGPPWC